MRKLLVLIAAVAFVAAFTAPAFAAEWSFYGSSRISTFWEDQDEDLSATGDDDLDLNFGLQGNSRIGANVKAGDISGKFEYGTGVNLRVLWGEYDFGAFKLGLGQNYSPVNFFISNQVQGGDTDMLPYGGIYSGRNPMIRFQFGDFQLAFVEPDTPISSGAFAGEAAACEEGVVVCSEEAGCIVDTDVVFPRLEARYNFTMGAVMLELGAGWQTYDVVGLDEDGDEEEESITSYIVYLGGKFNQGPFYFGADIWFGQNTGNMTMNFGSQPVDDALVLCEDEDVEDANGMGWLAVVGFTANDMLRFEGGYGSVSFDRDDFDEDDEQVAYYVQATVNLGKGIFIVPEIGKVDLRDDPAGEDEGSFSYYGAKWQINF